MGGIRYLKRAGKNVEDPRHIGGALNVGVAAQCVDSAAGASNVAQKKLYDAGGADDLSPETMLRPTDRVNNGGDFLHVAILAHRGEQIGGFQELVLRNAGDALDHFRRIALVLLLQQLKHATRMLERQIEGNFFRKRGCYSCPCPNRPAALVARSETGIACLLLRDRKSTRLNSSHLGISYAV